MKKNEKKMMKRIKKIIENEEYKEIKCGKFRTNGKKLSAKTKILEIIGSIGFLGAIILGNGSIEKIMNIDIATMIVGLATSSAITMIGAIINHEYLDKNDNKCRIRKEQEYGELINIKEKQISQENGINKVVGWMKRNKIISALGTLQTLTVAGVALALAYGHPMSNKTVEPEKFQNPYKTAITHQKNTEVGEEKVIDEKPKIEITKKIQKHVNTPTKQYNSVVSSVYSIEENKISVTDNVYGIEINKLSVGNSVYGIDVDTKEVKGDLKEASNIFLNVLSTPKEAIEKYRAVGEYIKEYRANVQL